jgi:hypothetical protein
MPPGVLSRHLFTRAIQQPDGTITLTDREPFEFRELQDTRRIKVQERDTLFGFAAFYFNVPSFERPSDLWWVIADFQPTPIFDPTIKLTPGSTIHIPSIRVVLEEVFSEKRRVEFL